MFGLGSLLSFIPGIGPILSVLSALFQAILKSFAALLKALEAWLAVGLLCFAIYLVGHWQGAHGERKDWQARWEARDRAVEKAVAERVAAAEKAKDAIIAEQEAEAKELEQQLSQLETDKNAYLEQLKSLAQNGRCTYRPGQRERLQQLIR